LSGKRKSPPGGGKGDLVVRRFFVADLSNRGDVLATAEYQYEQLEKIPGAADLIVHFATNLYRAPEEFETTTPHSQHMTFRWRASAETAGIATLRDRGNLTSLGLFASGINPEADHLTLDAFVKHLLRELRNTEFEPSLALMQIEQRPLVAVVPFQAPAEQRDQIVAALADRCFAAAYFRYLKLA
jgi:hypothetical protein